MNHHWIVLADSQHNSNVKNCSCLIMCSPKLVITEMQIPPKNTTVADKDNQINVRSPIPIKEWSLGNLWNTKLGPGNRYYLSDSTPWKIFD